MADRDLYATLGVPRTASAAEIKKAYRKLARELHPDRNPGNKKSEERFKDVAYANDILSEPDKRALYDEFGEIGLKEGFDAEKAREYARYQERPAGRGRGRTAGSVEDILRGVQGRGGVGFGGSLEDLFGGLGGAGADPFGAPRKGQDFESEIELTLPEVLRGVEREITLAEPGGSRRTVRARIPAGARDGSKVRLRGQGGAARGGAPGDLVLVVRVAAHPFFRVEGDDLYVELPVTLREAWHGAKVQVPTPDGDVTLRIPPKTQGGAQLRLKGKGAPTRDGGHGDLYVRVQLRLPEDVPGASEHIDALVNEADVRAAVKL